MSCVSSYVGGTIKLGLEREVTGELSQLSGSSLAFLRKFKPACISLSDLLESTELPRELFISLNLACFVICLLGTRSVLHDAKLCCLVSSKFLRALLLNELGLTSLSDSIFKAEPN